MKAMKESWDDILMSEHRVMEKVLEVLEGEAKKAADSNTNAEVKERISESLDFFETFMDKCHNMKEEKVLFPRLEQRGIPREGGPIGVMLLEHQKEREFLKAIIGSLDKNQFESVLEHSRGFGELVKDHVWKEDNTLYPMGKKVLSEADSQKLVTGFDGIEKDLSKGVHEKYHNLA
jgi:hemerythrin-like domain-containing protein